MASLKEIRGRLQSVKGTLKITSAMRLISSAKLHSAQNAISNMLPYVQALNNLMNHLASGDAVRAAMAGYVCGGDENAGTAVVVVSSNQRLCGAFNVNVFKAFEQQNFDRDTTDVYAVGKVGAQMIAKQGYNVINCSDMAEKPDFDKSVKLASDLTGLFLAGKLKKVVLIYAHFASHASQPILVETYLPMQPVTTSSTGQTDYIIEPVPEKILEELIPKLLFLRMHTAFLDASAAEHAARTLAMQVASDNAEDLISELSLQYNKLRQQAITSEILDLVGGKQD